MAGASAVWGIDVGQCALKALRVQLTADGSMEVTNFDIIEHPKILSQPDAETDQLIQNALDKFLSRNEIGKAKVALAVPGQSSFARFVKLPPVESKRIPEIVKFEAVQQIPFDIDEVEWDYQTFSSDKSPEVEVGIFAMRKELVIKHLSYLRAAGIEVDFIQLAPLALYNMMAYDGLTAKTGATILIDVGAENTDLVITDAERIWLRSIPLGGNNFSEALVKAFKLPFSRAENLKRTAATSKYARQIFVAMRPVFGDLVSEVQRSIGFYTSLHREAQMSRVLCMGNAFRLPGLQKYLEQNLQVETVRPASFNKLKSSPAVNAPAFAENLWSYGVAYGLGVQGLGVAPIGSNLLPFSIARQRSWQSQRTWVAAAAAAIVVGVGLASYSAAGRNAHATQQEQAWATWKPAQKQSELDEWKNIVARWSEAERSGGGAVQPGNIAGATELQQWKWIQDAKQKLKNQGQQEIAEIIDIKQTTGYRDVVGQLVYLIQNSLPTEWRDDAIKVLAHGKSPEQIDFRKDIWSKVGTADYQKRKDFIKGPDGKDQEVNKLNILLVGEMQMEFWQQGKPPAGGKSDSAGPSPGGQPGAMAGGGAGAQAGGSPQGGAMGQAGNNPAGQKPAAGGPAKPVAPDNTPKYLRVTMTVATNAPSDVATGHQDAYAFIQNDFLNRINSKCPRADGGKPSAADPLLTHIRLREPLHIDRVGVPTTLTARPGYWPPMNESADQPAGGGAGGPAGGPTPPAVGPAVGGGGAVSAASLDYPLTSFKLTFDVQVIPPAPAGK